MDEEIGPWNEEAQTMKKEPQRSFRIVKGPAERCRKERRKKAKDTSAPHSVQVSPVSFRSPDFKPLLPVHTWKPTTPAHLIRLKASPDPLGLLVAKTARPFTPAHASLDITVAKKALLKLVRPATRSPAAKERADLLKPSTGSLFKANPIAAMSKSPIVQKRAERPYRRRVKETNYSKLSYPEYDQLAENLTDKLCGLFSARPKTSHSRYKTPSQRDTFRDDLRATFSQIMT